MRRQELLSVKPMVQRIRIDMPRLGARKLYFLLKPKFERAQVKLGRNRFFNYLRSKHMLIKLKNNYIKTTN